MKPYLAVPCAALAAALLAAACGKAPEAKPEDVRPVRAMKIASAAAPRTLELAGELRPRYETRLGFRVGGKITERLVEVGSPVRAGQIVARLDARDFELAEAGARSLIAQIEAEKKFAAADLQRYRELRAKNFISEAEYERRVSLLDAIEARLSAARAQHLQAANQAGYTRLAADSAGVVTALEAEAGQVVAAGQTVVRIARREARGVEIEAVVAVPESRREAFEKAAAFTVYLNAMPGRSWTGRLRELSPVADPASRTYAAKITLLDPGESVELGMSARVAATLDTREQAIELPVAALYGKGETPQVWLVDAVNAGIGTARLQAVKTAGLAGDRVLIGDGLAAGDIVVVAGAQLLRAGQRVRLEAATPAAGPPPAGGSAQPVRAQ